MLRIHPASIKTMGRELHDRMLVILSPDDYAAWPGEMRHARCEAGPRPESLGRPRRPLQAVGAGALQGASPDARRPASGRGADRPARARVTARCAWCGDTYEPGGRGSEQRFCGAACRAAFHRALRRWALGELAAGRVTVTQLRTVPADSVKALRDDLGAFGPAPAPPSADGLAAASGAAAAPGGSDGVAIKRPLRYHL